MFLEIQFFTKLIVISVLFTLIRFVNGECRSLTSRAGICYTQNECLSLNGIPGGSCAAGYVSKSFPKSKDEDNFVFVSALAFAACLFKLHAADQSLKLTEVTFQIPAFLSLILPIKAVPIRLPSRIQVNLF